METQVHVCTNDPQVYFVKNEVYIDFNSEKIHKTVIFSQYVGISVISYNIVRSIPRLNQCTSTAFVIRQTTFGRLLHIKRIPGKQT